MEASAGFGTSQLFLTDSRLALAVLNHLRYRALNHMFGMSHEQANVLTVVLLLGAADGLAAPGLRRTAQRMRAAEQRLRAAEQRVRSERIRRYLAAQDRRRTSAA